MNFYMYRSLNVGEKRTIATFLFLLLLAIIVIALTMPHPEKDCLVEAVTADGSAITLSIKKECASKLVESITFASQIRHVFNGAISFTFLYLIIYFGNRFLSWVNKRPN